MDSVSIETGVDELVDVISRDKCVCAVGMSGDERPFPQRGEGDIDLFVYCTEIPDAAERSALLSPIRERIEPVNIGRLGGGHWGQGDCCSVGGVETWLLYFTVADASAELENTLHGTYRWRLDNYYYPIGRCAMWKTMRALYDPDELLSAFKAQLQQYPAALARAVIAYHKSRLEDAEDLERAVGRKDVFFYHFSLDLALDHFLQILFALNGTYFPSRKRSEAYIQGFKIKPDQCDQRLLRVIACGGAADTLAESYAGWCDLAQELIQLID